MARREKDLSQEDKELWDRVKATLTPIHPDDLKLLAEAEDTAVLVPEDPANVEADVASLSNVTSTVMRAPKAPKPSSQPPLAPLDRHLRQKLGRGKTKPERRLDLHGCTQSEAHHLLRGFLAQSQANGCRTVLVITGKGSGPRKDMYDERGVLRRVVPQWLALPDMRHLVVGFEEAHGVHGGAGALYVWIRKRKGGV